MVDLADPKFYLAIGGLVALAIGLAVFGWASFKGYKEHKQRLALLAELEDILRREDIQRLRHRDFDEFCKRVNKVREDKGQAPVEPKFLQKIQYNLMYALDESDF
jgi:hypothetical protein